MKSDLDLNVFYEGKIRDISDAGACLIRNLIEEDYVNSQYYEDGEDPYRSLADRLSKKERTTRAWAFDWLSSSGTKPNIIDFLNIITMTKSRRAVEFLESLISDATPEQQAKNHGNLMKKAAEHIRELAATLDMLGENM